MASSAPMDNGEKYHQAGLAQTLFIFYRSKAFLNAFDMLVNYNYDSLGTMLPVNFTIPNTTDVLGFDPGNSEITYNSSQFSSLTNAEKAIAYKYLDKFIKHCLQQYRIDYNI